MKKGREKMLTT